MKFKPAFEVENRVLGIKTEIAFRHTTIKDCGIEARLLQQRYEILIEERRVTICAIRFTNTDKEVSEFIGVAICHPKDNFNKHKARVKSLTKAMIGWEREQATEIWAAYWKWRGGIGK